MRIMPPRILIGDIIVEMHIGMLMQMMFHMYLSSWPMHLLIMSLMTMLMMHLVMLLVNNMPRTVMTMFSTVRGNRWSAFFDPM